MNLQLQLRVAEYIKRLEMKEDKVWETPDD